MQSSVIRTPWFAFVVVVLAFTLSPRAAAHCDTVGGPVIADARTALDRGDVTPVLKWVRPEDEPEVKAAFGKALQVREAGSDAAELADRYFFETLVRVHRAGEGAPFTGLHDDDVEIEPGIEAADAAISSGSVDSVVEDLAAQISVGVRARFHRVEEARRHKDESVEAGREFVEAYVDYIHYVERLYRDAAGSVTHGGDIVDPHEHEEAGR